MKEKKYRLPKEIGEKWLVALRSNLYKQSEGSLYDEEVNGYCCLGLLGSICGIENSALAGSSYIQTANYTEDEVIAFRKLGYPEELSSLEEFIDNDLGGKSLPIILSEMNDSGSSFKTIAEFIEENVEFYE